MARGAGKAFGPTPRRPVRRIHPTQPFQGDFPMTWQTPQAVDIRFGFEITMYAAAR
jgi:coenzyme PQQ precursor peptide PqqA